MGEEPFEEVVLVANSGTVFIRGGYGREEVCLGLADGRADEPTVLVELTPLQRKRLVEALLELAAPPSVPCWFCDAMMLLPLDCEHGLVQEDHEVRCPKCGGLHRTCEYEDAGGAIGVAPVQCGHGVSHDDGCRRCRMGEKR